MSLTSAFIVPHPPLIIPEIGRGQQGEIQETIEAYQRIAQMIAGLKPETIVMATPHSVLYADYLHISPGDGAVGDFEAFGAPSVQFKVSYDTELREALITTAQAQGIPAGTLGEKKPTLDHGTMVPLYFINQYYQDYQMVRISISGLSRLTHYSLGKCLAQAAERIGKRVVMVASGDLSHKLKDEGPYGFTKEGPVFDREVTEAMAGGDFLRFLTLEEELCEAAAECGLRSFVMMAGALNGKDIKPKLLSYQGTFGVGYAVASFEINGENPERQFDKIYARLEEERVGNIRKQESEPVRLARMSLEHYLQTGRTLPRPESISENLTANKAGVFVSLKENGRLRGCIGTISATTASIAEEIIQNAISAGTQDPRFEPVEEEEMPQLVYSVDILGKAESVPSEEKLDPHKYGVIVEYQGKRGLLLPNLEGVDSVEEQVAIALQKAGIHPNMPYTIERFEVVRYQ